MNNDGISFFSNLDMKRIQKVYQLIISNNQDQIVGEERKELIKLLSRTIILYNLMKFSEQNELLSRLIKLEKEMEEIKKRVEK